MEVLKKLLAAFFGAYLNLAESRGTGKPATSTDELAEALVDAVAERLKGPQARRRRPASASGRGKNGPIAEIAFDDGKSARGAIRSAAPSPRKRSNQAMLYGPDDRPLPRRDGFVAQERTA